MPEYQNTLNDDAEEYFRYWEKYAGDNGLGRAPETESQSRPVSRKKDILDRNDAQLRRLIPDLPPVFECMSPEVRHRDAEENSRLHAEEKAVLAAAKKNDIPKPSWFDEHSDDIITLEGILSVVLGIVLAFLYS